MKEKLETRLLTSDIDRSSLVALGLRYLEEANVAAMAVPTATAAGAATESSSYGDGMTPLASDDGDSNVLPV